jgi:hypothetical protein
VFEKRLEKSHRPSSRPIKSDFEKMLIDLKKKLREFTGFWKETPYKMCDSQGERPYTNLQDQDSCWNGQEPGSYAGKVVEDGVASQAENPEVAVKLDGSNAMLDTQKFKLRSLTNVLKLAYRGQDVDWWDEEEDTAVRDGSGAMYDDYTDDEDGFGSGDEGDDSMEGSGGNGEDGGEEEHAIIVPVWQAGKTGEDGIDFGDAEEGDAWSPWPKFPDSPPSSPRPEVTGGTSSIHLKSRWAVVRAVATYSLPMLTCYFGGFLTEVPWLFQ